MDKNRLVKQTRCALLLYLVAIFVAMPLYAGGTTGVVARELGNVEIEPIAGKAGWHRRWTAGAHWGARLLAVGSMARRETRVGGPLGSHMVSSARRRTS